MQFPEGVSHDVQGADRYLGIDPGLNRTGYAILDRTSSGPRLREGGIIRSNASGSLPQRLRELTTGLTEVLEQFQPQVTAIEQVFSMGRNPRTALLMAHARGALLSVLANHDLSVIDYSPTQIKRLLTGNGRASKEQVQHAIRNELGLPSVLEPNDVADASAIALCLYHSVRFVS